MRRDDCICGGKAGCGFEEVFGSLKVKLLREFGAVVHDGLNNRLPGWWVRACQVRAWKVEKALEFGSGGTFEPFFKAQGEMLARSYREELKKRTGIG